MKFGESYYDVLFSNSKYFATRVCFYISLLGYYDFQFNNICNIYNKHNVYTIESISELRYFRFLFNSLYYPYILHHRINHFDAYFAIALPRVIHYLDL